MAGARHALLIGMSSFQDERVPALPSSEHGLAALSEVLGDPDIGAFTVTVLHNPSRVQLINVLGAMTVGLGARDLLLIYYIGHGIRRSDAYLDLVVDGTNLDDPSTTVPVDAIIQLAGGSSVGQLVLVLDCCYSGLSERYWPPKLPASSPRTEDLFILSSSGAGEVSYERPVGATDELSQSSVFTGALVRGLGTGEADLDGDGLIDIRELFEYLTTEVGLVAEQSPQMFAAYHRDALIAKAGAGEWSVRSRGYGDRPAVKDLLRRQAMLRTFVDLIEPEVDGTDNDLAGPTVIALDGPWGVGKTSVIDLAEDVLRNRKVDPYQADQVKRLSAWAARRALGGKGRPLWTKRMVARGVPGKPPPLITARFEPRAHQTGEQVWAGLTNTLLDAVSKKFFRGDRVVSERYWFERNIDRVDKARLRTVLLKGVASPWFALAALALVAPIVAQLARSRDYYKFMGWFEVTGASLALVTMAAAILVGAGDTVRCYRRPAADYLPAELFEGPVASGSFVDGKGDETLRDPYRNARSGYLYLLQHDVFTLLRDVRDARHHIVLFVDDLDRCTPRTTAEVFEAINLFVTKTFPVTRFVLCLDTTAVVAHLDEAHSALKDKSLHADDPSPGWSFLRKLIQLTIPLPVIPQAIVSNVLDELMPRPVVVAAPVPVPESHATPAPQRLSAPAPAPVMIPSDAATKRVAQVLEHDERVRARIVERLADQPTRSVREMKRLLTAWTYYVRVLTRSRPLTNASSVAEAERLVVLAEISSRWPAAVRGLHRRFDERCGLGVLANAAHDDWLWAEALRKLCMHTEPHRKCANGIRELLRRYDGLKIAELAAELH